MEDIGSSGTFLKINIFALLFSFSAYSLAITKA
jgi:hypothetical protein